MDHLYVILVIIIILFIFKFSIWYFDSLWTIKLYKEINMTGTPVVLTSDFIDLSYRGRSRYIKLAEFTNSSVVWKYRSASLSPSVLTNRNIYVVVSSGQNSKRLALGRDILIGDFKAFVTASITNALFDEIGLVIEDSDLFESTDNMISLASLVGFTSALALAPKK